MKQLDALGQMLEFRSVRNVRYGNAVIVPPDGFDGLIDFADCSFNEFRANFAHISSPVKFENCTFDSASFYATYFYGGFIMRNCTVHGSLSFESGGHNDNGEFALVDSGFGDLVNFEDCWFTGPLLLDNVTFPNGSNLLGNHGTPVSVTFDVPHKITRITGRYDIDTYR